MRPSLDKTQLRQGEASLQEQALFGTGHCGVVYGVIEGAAVLAPDNRRHLRLIERFGLRLDMLKPRGRRKLNPSCFNPGNLD
ncbi:hypothetical protein [Hydrogenophaga sp.]|uniref:hypothetical protein n=1 Tax=Hydrogenophaga sp. TaxID=1904254 RepID=UPI002FC99D6B